MITVRRELKAKIRLVIIQHDFANRVIEPVFRKNRLMVNEEIGKKKLTQKAYDAEIVKVKDLYKKGEPYFLKVKELEPDNPERWASRLRTIYYILGDKEKEKEMDAYLGGQ